MKVIVHMVDCCKNIRSVMQCVFLDMKSNSDLDAKVIESHNEIRAGGELHKFLHFDDKRLDEKLKGLIINSVVTHGFYKLPHDIENLIKSRIR